jgi:PAS domain S-box-containing protein
LSDRDRIDEDAATDGVSSQFMILTVVTALAATASIVAFAATQGWHVASQGRFWLLSVFVVGGELFPIPVPGRFGRDKVTVSTAFAFALLLSVGVLPAAAVYAAASAIGDLASRTSPPKVVFNSAHYGLAVAAGGGVLALGGFTPPLPINGPHLPVLFAAGVAMLIVNHVVAGAGAALLLAIPVGPYLRTDLAFQGWTAGCVLAFAPAVVLSAEASLALVPVTFVPMLAIFIGWRHAARELLSAQQRAETEERYRLALDATGDGMFDFDLRSGVAFWSDSLLEILGYEVTELPVTPDAWVAQLVHPADQPLFHSTEGSGWAAAERFQIDARLRHADGGYTAYSIVGSTQRDERDHPFRLLGSVRDISAARRAELQRVALARDLHDGVVQDLAASSMYVSTARKLLERDSGEADRLLAVVAHEIKASVASLRLLLGSLRSGSPVQEEGSSVDSVVRAVIEEFNRRGSSFRVALNVDAADADRLTPVALQTLSHVLRETLRNARQHSHAQTATVDVHGAGEQLLLDVRDDGVGFDPSMIPSGHYGIAGMRERAQRAGGTLSLDSQPGRGVHLRLQLPKPFQERDSEPVPGYRELADAQSERPPSAVSR